MPDKSKVKSFLKKNWLLIIAFIYLISPFDFIPEAVFGPLGLPDDVTLIVVELIRRFVANRSEKE